MKGARKAAAIKTGITQPRILMVVALSGFDHRDASSEQYAITGTRKPNVKNTNCSAGFGLILMRYSAIMTDGSTISGFVNAWKSVPNIQAPATLPATRTKNSN